MDALTLLDAPLGVDFRGHAMARLGRIVALVVLVLLALTGLLICWRRANGALVEPLPAGVLAFLGVALAVLAVLFRKTFAASPLSRAARYAVWAAPSAVLLAWVAGVSLSGSDTLGLVALVGVLLLEEGWSWGRLATVEPPAPRIVVRPLAAPVVERPAIEDEREEAVTQKLIRRTEQAGEVIEGWVRVDFAALQRHATAHVAICPPLDRMPKCFAEQADGPSAAIKVAQVLPYGVRFELKLDEPPAEAMSVFVEFSIQERESTADKESPGKAGG